MEWDLFICYASEDKRDFIQPLVKKLVFCGLKVWYDDDILVLGDSLRRSIDKGLSKSRYGIVVLSPFFFEKEWPQKELDGLVAREREGIKVILPIWHKVEFGDVVKYSPTLADRIAAKSSEGIDEVVNKVQRSIQRKNESTAIDSSKYYQDLSEEEANVLLSALHFGGEIKIIETGQIGRFLQIGDRDYYDINHPEIRISYLEVLNKLIGRDLVFQETERWFNLTKIGFEYARSFETNDLMEKAWYYYENEKNYTESIRLYREIVKKYPKSETSKEAQKMIGINYLHLDDSINAELELKKCIDMRNDFSSAFFYYGEALQKNKKFQEAKTAFEHSLSKPDTPDWIKAKAPEKMKLCIKKIIMKMALLADEKYKVEQAKINANIEIKENNLKERKGIQGLRWSSVLARELLNINITEARRKIGLRLKLDKDIIFSGQPIKSDEDIAFLYNRLKVIADPEREALKKKIMVIYKECHTENLLSTDTCKIDDEIDMLMQERLTDLKVEKEQVLKEHE